jgi:hypothetical protein
MMKNISTLALISITTGRLFCDFDVMHEAIEHVAGRSVWTHEFPTLFETLRDIVLKQHPHLSSIDDDIEKINVDSAKHFANLYVSKFGETLPTAQGQITPRYVTVQQAIL